MKKFILRDRRAEMAFILALVVLFAYIASRHIGAYPSVFADEQIYSRFARLLPLRDVTIPSYLYLSVFGLTNACGDAFLDCARYLNLLFFVGSAPFIYLATREFAARRVAMLAALICVAAPTGTYAAYFMPESMYFFGFAVLTWIALARSRLHWALYAAATGAVLGMMTLVKVHALFLIPALALFIAYIVWTRRPNPAGLLESVAAALLNIAAVFAVKFVLGYLFAGAAGLQLLGSFYGNQASNGANTGTTLLTMLPAAWFSLQGHLMMLALLFAVPLAALLHHGMSRTARASAAPQVSALMAYTVLMMGAALALTVLYTASTAGYGPLDGKRLHVRYYTFALILPVMIAAAHAGGARRRTRAVLPWAIAALLACAIAYACVALPPAYVFVLADSPEIIALGMGQPASMAALVIGAAVLVLALWAWNSALGGIAFLLLFMPLYLVNGEPIIAAQMARARVASVYDDAGRFAHGHLGAAQRNQLRIVGDNHGELLRARFHVDAPGAMSMVLPAERRAEIYAMPALKHWLLVIGDYRMPSTMTPSFRETQYALYAPNNRALGAATFSGSLDNGVLAGAEGLAGAEDWGRWSNTGQVRLHFRETLPKRVNLFLTMRAFGPNEGKDFVVRVGAAEARVKLGPHPHEVFLQFETDGKQKDVTIDVPQPVSPKELGWSGDIRELGLGISRVEIGAPLR
ncbi:hypothetical protein HHL21_08725 [Massilia sp. RP-1-19]|uniref:DUF7024 domain-containing protein n=1 Tax=Massilia polaris TaxID=2728846 RepID=A0A848HJA3_9BURK|nr:hypothetical protein [Massilia polaris]NML61162.1 hypothetical protein [Massilia polaris]